MKYLADKDVKRCVGGDNSLVRLHQGGVAFFNSDGDMIAVGGRDEPDSIFIFATGKTVVTGAAN